MCALVVDCGGLGRFSDRLGNPGAEQKYLLTEVMSWLAPVNQHPLCHRESHLQQVGMMERGVRLAEEKLFKMCCGEPT